MKIKIVKILMCCTLLFAFGCTDLEIESTGTSELAPTFLGYDTNELSESALDQMYNEIRGYIGDQGNLYAMSEVTTDAQLIPTRGSDWGDNGLWRQMHTHGWTPDHAFINNTWNQWNSLQLSGTRIVIPESTASAETKGHGYFLRALGMYVILDNYGQVPFRTLPSDPNLSPEVLTGDAAVSFIVSDLEAAIQGLPSSTAGSDNVRATKAAARYLLAKVLLNKHVYLGSTPDNADMARVISLVTEIEGDNYELQSGFFDIFRDSPDSETVWYINTGVGNRIFNTLHYNSTTAGGGGWNGFSTLAEYYDLFEGDPNENRYDADGNPLDGQEERRGGVPPSGDAAGTEGSNVGFGFLIGQQYNLDGSPLQDRAGAPLSFTREFFNAADGSPSLVDNNEISGIRLLKYNPRYGGFNEHEIFFRYSDAYLMKAEAMLRSGQDITAMINELRVLRGASPLGAVSEQELLDERGRELYMEFWRRQDLIRFGQYTRDWEFKDPAAVNNPDRQLFPIPASQVILNPNLAQNPGY